MQIGRCFRLSFLLSAVFLCLLIVAMAAAASAPASASFHGLEQPPAENLLKRAGPIVPQKSIEELVAILVAKEQEQQINMQLRVVIKNGLGDGPEGQSALKGLYEDMEQKYQEILAVREAIRRARTRLPGPSLPPS
ncbi:hypothetical protein CF336_g8698 [Tilletia laevis]|uniref:Uncharacterized protein n=1 Tax=Tilletia caries TaxID=13290 RepID=A0A177T462_9BASI|nr:hypothetical protein CF336_g8698 [Tilletia laevis]KAE8183517.1 hypothetical protein CF335_g8300 [Tilletia laevis]KAE8241105.1 hypothetical protein A4X03_0g8215 [Tilletia caries]